MIFVVVDDIIPEAQTAGNGRYGPDIHIMEERGAPLLGKARGMSENLGRKIGK